MTSDVFEIGVPVWRRAWLYAVGVFVILFLMIPVLIVVPMSFSDSQYLEFPPRGISLRWYENYFRSIEWMDATWISVQVAFLTVMLSVPLGTAAAYGLMHARSRLVPAMKIVIIAPMIVPVIIIAIGVFYLYAKIGILNTIIGLVMAHTVLAIPFVMIVMLAAFSRFDFNLEKAAVSLGASRFLAFLTITLPLVLRSVFSAALLALITSLDEVVIALFISLGEKSTLTRRMFESLRDQIDPTIAAISTLLICISVTVVVLYGLQSTSGQNRS
jgi:putative spermidine/putrescine transport system permease protein